MVAARLRRPERRGLALRAVGLAAAVLVALAVVLVGVRRDGPHATPPEIQQATLETRANEQELVTLADGSRIFVLGATRVHLAAVSRSHVLIELERGEIDAEVTHVEGRPFVVSAAGVDVSVVGTHFRVRVEGEGAAPRVSVEVLHGRVEVTRSRDGIHRVVDAGETWSSGVEPPPTTSASPPDQDAPPDAGPLPAPAPAPTGFRLPARFHQLAADGRYADAYAALGSVGVARAARTARVTDLFEVGQVARYDGHPREAVDAFRALVKRYPGDGRAGIAGLEAGRLLLNELGDPEAAAEAFEEAMRLAPSESFREDALARRVQALEATGDQGACVAAREQYMKSYPSGTHAVTVARRCPGP